MTENYTGFMVEGNFDDLNELYDSINHFLEEGETLEEEEMRLHVLGFLYDVRHAYQGDRIIVTKENLLTEEQKEDHEIKKSVKEDVLYRFPYVCTDLICDMALMEYFFGRNEKKGEEHSLEYYQVKVFYEKALEALKEVLTSSQINKIREEVKSAFYLPINFYRQWFIRNTQNFLSMTKKKRQKEMMNCFDEIYHWHHYEDYFDLKEMVEEYASRNNCNVTKIEIGQYPEEIEW